MAVLGVLLAAAPRPALAQAPIGVDAAVNPQAVGTPPAGTPRALATGQPVLFNERIATADSGQTQIVFRDQSTLSVGPASDLVIDQFVYDPNAGAAKLAMSATRGVFRFVGGEASKLGSPVTLAAPTGTLGIRGGIFLARIAADGGLTVVFVYGRDLTVTGRNGVVTVVRRPGFAATVDHAGNPSPPFPAPRELIASLVGQFDGTGDARLAAITDARLAAYPIFARLVSDIEERSRPRVGEFGGGSIDLLGRRETFDIDTVAAQGDPRLRGAILLFRNRQPLN